MLLSNKFKYLINLKFKKSISTYQNTGFFSQTGAIFFQFPKIVQFFFLIPGRGKSWENGTTSSWRSRAKI